MKTIEVGIQKQARKYQVCVGENIIELIPDLIDLAGYSSIYIITDSNVSRHYLKPVIKIFSQRIANMYSFVFPAGESSKQIGTVVEIWKDMAKNMIDRKALIVNLGGGVVTDLGGYAASGYLRGVSFINISTTLEGMVDASVGGKTGVNLGTLKNYIGSFTQPELVVCDVETLKTLPHRVLIQGYAEVIKHGLIEDSNYFEEAVKKSPLEMTDKELIDIVAESVHIKSEIVRQDETEHRLRKLLNFGHTVGHVIESHSMKSQNPLFHGEAVSIGMIAESYICQLIGMITEKEFNKIESGIKRVGLPVRYEGLVVDDVLRAMLTDKKVEKGHIKWTLLSGIGQGEFNVSVDDKFVKKAIEYIVG
ncbi:3-dehydroquinate synthase [Candidatus Roizmanbacteria bacterium]|nr:MAG: 3-dehydroquinate synthase [Candidatus Roizmanbacteria bacterium]